MYKIIVVLLTMVVSACGTTSNSITRTPTESGHVTTYTNLDNKTVRFVTKHEAVKELCDNQSFRHNEQRQIFSLPAAMLKGVDSAAKEAFVVYNPSVLPFDMRECLVEGMKSGWERIGYRFLDLGKQLVKYGAGYALLSKAIDKVGQGKTTTINGDNNNVRTVEGDGNEYNEAGGLPADKFDQVNLQPTEPETGPDEAACVAAGGEWVADESRCSDGQGGTLEL